MKTYGHLFEQICALDNLYLAARKARRLKSRKLYVEDFELHRERFLGELRDELRAGAYRPSGYKQFRIYDPKERLICAAPYRDRVVHHALCNVIGPLLERRFIADSFSCQQGKGTEAARERCRRYTNRYAWVLKCDVRKFFQSIDHGILKQKLARLIRCEPTLALCGLIIDSYRDTELPPAWHADDDLFAPFDRPRGLPIGNLTSQLWANFYLDDMDHCVKEVWRAAGYARYTDDWLIWGDEKSVMWSLRDRIAETLDGIRLRLNPVKTRLSPTRTGVPFLGFRFYPGRRPRVAGETRRRFERRTRRQMRRVAGREMTMDAVRESADGWTQFARYGNVEGLMRNYRENGFGQTGT